MNDSFSVGKRRRDFSSFFSPSKTNTSLQRRCYNDNTTARISCSQLNAEEHLESLLSAIESKDVDSFTEMLATCKSVNVNQIVPDRDMTLLHYSVGYSDNDPQIVKALLMLGGDPNNVNIPQKYSPLHISALYDYEKVMSLLIEYGGDLQILTGDQETCFDIVRKNFEDESLENCLAYLIQCSNDFRKSIGSCKASNHKRQELHDSGSDGFYSCESANFSDANSHFYAQNERIHSFARKICPDEYSNFMTEDESAEASSDEEDVKGKKLTTIKEESTGTMSALSPGTGTMYTPSPARRGIGSMTAPIYVLSDDDSISYISDCGSGPSCVNSTPPVTPQPTKKDLEILQQRMKQLNIPVTPTTYGVISKVSESDSKVQALLTPRTGVSNYSPELQAGIQDLNLIYEWGNLKVDLLQHSTPTAKTSKSFYNYLLLDPRIIKRANFSGDHLKTNVINNAEKFQKFLESIFYIGKAHGMRPLQHLYDAKQQYAELSRKALQNGEKIGKILEIWKSGLGVIIVNMYCHSSEREANVNEACMIDAMGLVELSNIKRGTYNGTVAASWSRKRKNQFGSVLLFNSFRTFVVTEPKQLYPHDF